ncbi:hypothetical protein IWQ62_001031 [Dispira parvispora]|uniref:Uncharacterized protein n=1 Tax=Dispira parvispora TaxID=1520584 RepID=A0A9W8AZC2_9FUNG|nr:hypothetical protein IWQ62_001031 [Dispira parvispora]
MSPHTKAGTPGSSLAVALYQLTGLTCFSLLILWLPETPQTNRFPGHHQYLTIIALYFTIACAGLGTLAVILPQWQQVRFAILPVALAGELVVMALYWSLKGLSKDYMFYQTDINFPWWLDLGLHVAPVVFLGLSFLANRHLIQPSALQRGLLLCFAAGYIVWIEYVHMHLGTWPYPFMTLFTLTQRLLFYNFATALVYLFYWSCFYLTRPWGPVDKYTLQRSQVLRSPKVATD